MRQAEHLLTLKKEADAQKEADDLNRVHRAIAYVTEVRFSVCFIRFSDFCKLGRLTSHEQCRSRGMLKTIDTYDELLLFAETSPTVFCSHQWQGYSAPDPDGVHFPAVVDACEQLCKREGIDPNALYLWLDYTSIPQANAYLQQLSINSLGIYSSTCKFFICVTPNTIHSDSHLPTDDTTYSKRGW